MAEYQLDELTSVKRQQDRIAQLLEEQASADLQEDERYEELILIGSEVEPDVGVSGRLVFFYADGRIEYIARGTDFACASQMTTTVDEEGNDIEWRLKVDLGKTFMVYLFDSEDKQQELMLKIANAVNLANPLKANSIKMAEAIDPMNSNVDAGSGEG